MRRGGWRSYTETMSSPIVRAASFLRSRPRLAWPLCATALPLANALLCRLFKDLPLFMDSIFTALAAAVLGPWQGLLVAILTNGYIEALTGFGGLHLPFALCGAATALLVAAAVRSRRSWTPLGAAAAVLAVTLANAVLGAAIATFVYGGSTRVNIDSIAAGFAVVADSIFTAAFLARLPINVIDKALAVLPALALAAALREAGGEGAPRAAVPCAARPGAAGQDAAGSGEAAD